MSDNPAVTPMTQGEYAIVVDGETYYLDLAPRHDSPLVKSQVAQVLGNLSLDDITENLDLAVELFYVAYHGVAGAAGGTLQADIATLQSRLAMLCNACVETMTTFQNETLNIIDQLIQTYRWLTRGNEQLAITKLAHCKESSTAMSKSANALAADFKGLQVDSTKARASAIVAEGSEEDKLKAAQQAQADMIAKQKAETANQGELVDQLNRFQQLYDEAKAREEKESTKALVTGIFSALGGALGAGLGAYAAAQNPLGRLMGAGAASTGNPQVDATQKDAAEKKRLADEAQQKLLAAKDAQNAKKLKVDKLTSDIADLNKKIAAKETDPTAKEDELKQLKQARDAKQQELNAANTELTQADANVKQLEPTAQTTAAAFAAAGASLQDLAKSTGQMSQAAASAEESIHQEKMMFLNKKLELEDQKRKSLVALAEYAENIKNFQAAQATSQITVDSLHTAVDALGKIIGSLTNASLFWDQMSNYCSRMSDKGFQQDFNDLVTQLKPEERLAEYSRPYFMNEFLVYMCQWVAVNGLSGDYCVSAAKAQQKAVAYIGQSPTIEEAIRMAPELAKNLEMIIDKDLKASREASVALQQQLAVMGQKA